MTEEYSVQCQAGFPDSSASCVQTCVGIEECCSSVGSSSSTCPCAIIPIDAGGPGGSVVDVLLVLTPIAMLVYGTVKRTNPWPTSRSLPMAAALLFFIRLAYFQSDPILCGGAVILGLHEAITPLSIMAGAITLFETMEQTNCMAHILREIQCLCDSSRIAELMLLFAFVYMVEGASGFGTPVALSAPVLVRSGHAPLQSVVVLLLFNSFATVWGAVGTPVWFGLGESLEDLTEDDLLEISQKAAVALAFSAFILIPLILGILVPLRTEVIPNIVFVYMALGSTIGTSLAISFFNYEFPSLMGGLVGCVATGALVKFKIGLRKEDEEAQTTITTTADPPMEKPGEGKKEIPVSTSSINDSNHHIEIGFEEPTTNPPRSPNRSLAAGEMDPGDYGVSELHVHPIEPTYQQQTPQQQLQVRPSPLEHQASSIASIFECSEIPMYTENHDHSVKDYDRTLGPRKDWSEGYLREILQRTAPIWGVVLILILTRIPQVGIQKYLKQTTPAFTIYFGTWGTFRLSASLVFQLQNIFTYPGLNWSYALLYVPFVIPFLLVSTLTMIFFRKDLMCSPWKIANTVLNRLKVPVIAVMGALCLVQLMIRVDTAAPAFILGTILADWLEQGFIVISPLLGALGSFFSGSATVSNLTFGSVQEIAAESIGTSVTTMLALQCVGAAAGSAVSLNNIIAACAVVGLDIGEGPIVIRTSKFVLLSTTIATVVMLALFFRFD